jgi:hypothetical protein
MKQVLIILFLLVALSCPAQKVDTVVLKYFKYSYAKKEEARKYNHKYFVYKLGFNEWSFNAKDSILGNVFEEVSKEEYDAFIANEKKFDNCRGCWLKSYNTNNILIREGLFDTDCPIGEVRSYDGFTGKIMTKSFWKVLEDSEKTRFANRCSLRIGDWIYFKPDGSKEKIERYRDDVLIETIVF